MIANGKTVPLDPHLKDLLSQTLSAMIPGLQNGGEIKNLHISLRRKH
jgi:hypothetical protein